MIALLATIPLTPNFRGGVSVPEESAYIRFFDPNSTNVDNIFPISPLIPTGASYEAQPVESLIYDAADLINEVTKALPQIDEELESRIDQLIENSFSKFEAKPLSRQV
ncbi:MAG: hypothetical protein V3T17_07250 [Pseudomonadales bacterium]